MKYCIGEKIIAFHYMSVSTNGKIVYLITLM